MQPISSSKKVLNCEVFLTTISQYYQLLLCFHQPLILARRGVFLHL